MLLHPQGRIIFEGTEYKLHDIVRLINPICHSLQPYFKDNLRVGIAVKSRLMQICSILSVISCNCIYVPISPDEPVERIKTIVNQCCDVLISDLALETKVPCIKLDGLNWSIEDHKVCNEHFNPRYTIFTSGSTGAPKGVVIKRQAIINFIEGISEIIDFSAGRRIACLTNVSFDIFFLESIMALHKGLTVVLANEQERRNPELTSRLIRNHAVDMIQMTPSSIQLLLNYDKDLVCLENVKEIMIGGEPFPPNLLKILQKKTSAKIYNMYGPTETTIWSTVSDLTYKASVDIGRPIKNTKVYVVDENLSVLPDGEVGEILISGHGLADGYFGNHELTQESFVYLPFAHNTRAYKTGDLGRYLSNGVLECLGRIDNQVKLRGHRIELEEIEFYLNQFEGIKQSIVTIQEINANDRILSAFYTSETILDSQEINSFLASKLPSYMIPNKFTHVEAFFLTPNGKIDRKRILECTEVKTDPTVDLDYAATLNDIQKKAFEVIISDLDVKVLNNISLDSDFSSIGIDSINFIRLIVALENEFNFEVDDEMLLSSAFPTIRTMIEYVEAKVSKKGN